MDQMSRLVSISSAEHPRSMTKLDIKLIWGLSKKTAYDVNWSTTQKFSDHVILEKSPGMDS